MEELERVESAMEQYKHWSANALRSECRRLKTTPTSLNNASYLAALRSCLLVTGTIAATGVVQSPFRQAIPDQKTVDCVFRLLNVLFSDSFCDGVASLGDVATRHALDTHTTGKASPWFESDTAAYNDEDDESFNALRHVLPEFFSIDPAAFKQHDSKKLWAMWKEITRDYREADARFRKSGNNGVFAGFHGSKMGVYYPHLLTTITKPNLHACVVQTLPEEIMADSLETGSSSGKQPGKAVVVGKGTRADGVIEVLKEISRNEANVLLTKRQIVFFEESIELKRQKNARSETGHEVAVRAAKNREKKDSIELLVTLQKNRREMRRELALLEHEGIASGDNEVEDLRDCITKLKSELEACLH